ncbi:DUF721 domain-containing protein [Kitasatospora sp. NPDC004669]|uniref:DUF721 domain-containing protein n=1 Tax=Kitasatospora sp. NPDC004669 TaxID=3154555 RepID=UPI0033A3132B
MPPSRPASGPARRRPGAGSARTTGADLAGTALRAARQAARNAGNAPAKHKKPQAAMDGRGRDAREPARLNLVVPTLAASQGWALGMAGGSIQDRWAAIVGPDAATHWAPAGFDTTTRILRVLVDSPAWATPSRSTAPHRVAQPALQGGAA